MLSIKRDQDTICALATAEGAGAVAMIRLSGPQAEVVVRKVADFLPTPVESHRVYYGILRTPDRLNEVDEVLISYFAGGRSFTGEATFEISCHGGSVISKKILRHLIEAGARMAERGEFTYRAVMCGRINLIQAESILSLVSSENELTAQMALRQLRGELSVELNIIKDNLSWALSRLEANIDFAAEFIEFAAQEAIVNKLQVALTQTKSLLETYRAGQVLQNGVQVAIVGAPNVGKSSLLNALAKEERAIVSPVAGTTRDRVEADILVAGRKVKFIDTAGLRETEDQIENIGISRTKKTIDDADIILLVYDRTDKNTLTELLQTKVKEKRSIYIGNKSDLVSDQDGATSSVHEIFISTQTKFGLDKLVSEIEKYIAGFSIDTGSAVLHTRQYESLIKISEATARGLNLLIENASPEFVIADLNEAYIEILRLTGDEFDDQILDRVFKEFCLGK